MQLFLFPEAKMHDKEFLTVTKRKAKEISIALEKLGSEGKERLKIYGD